MRASIYNRKRLHGLLARATAAAGCCAFRLTQVVEGGRADFGRGSRDGM